MGELVKSIFRIISVAILVASCSDLQMREHHPNANDEFLAVVDDSEGKSVGSSTYGDSSGNVIWEAVDTIGIFCGTTVLNQYGISSGAGTTSAIFKYLSKKSTKGDTICTNVGVYPYQSNLALDTCIQNECSVLLTLQKTQKYRKGTYGASANPMIGVSPTFEDKKLTFKNICGFIVLHLTGNDTIRRIILSGNKGEYLAGRARVTVGFNDGIPSCGIISLKSKSITLDCGKSGVKLGSDTTQFWFSVPPKTFSEGINVSIINMKGDTIKRKTDNPIQVNRSRALPMSPFRVEVTEPCVKFSDDVFEDYCLSNFDKNQDGAIQKSEAEAVTSLSLTGKTGIKSLTGLQYFKNLKQLQCNNCGTVTSIDLTGLDSLSLLDFGDNQLTSIDLSPCPKLLKLYFARNKISSLNLKPVSQLTTLYCDSNQLTDLDISPCPFLKSLIYSGNPLSTVHLTTAQSKKFSFASSITVIITDASDDPEEIIQFEDAKFKAFCVKNYDTNSDGEISVTEAAAATKMNFPLGVEKYTSLRELPYFTGLQQFSLWSVRDDDYRCKFSVVDFSKCKNLDDLFIQDCDIDDLIISGCTKLSSLDLESFELKSIDLSFCSDLKKLTLINTGTEEVNLGSISNLERIVIWGTDLKGLDLSHCSKLVTLNCDGNTRIKSLDLSKCSNLDFMFAQEAGLEEVDLSACTKLTTLNLGTNKLTSLDLSKCTMLTTVDASENQLKSLDLSKLQALEQLQVRNNQLSELDVSRNDKLWNLICINNPLKTLYINELQSITGINNNRSTEKIPSTTNIVTVSVPDDSFSVSTSSFSLSCTATQIKVKVSCSGSYTFSYPSWINEVPTKSVSEHTFSVSQNESYAVRKGTITVNSLSDGRQIEVSITQDYGSLDYSRDGEVKILNKATVGNGIDVVFVGDAFCDKDLSVYDSYLADGYKAFFEEEPFASFKNRFNVYSITAVSVHDEIGKGTKFSTSFTGGTGISGNHTAVFNFVKKHIPGIDLSKATIIVLINSPKYAGTCYNWQNNQSISYVPLCTQNDSFGNVLRHESNGHCFAKMADEYVNYSSTTLPQSEINNYNAWKGLCYGFWENIDITNDPNSIKWSSFLNDSRYEGSVGIYEGAYLYGKGAYRASMNSIMRYNTGGFNAPSRESMYKRIMRYSEGDTWVYNREDFLGYDEKNRTKTKSTEFFIPPASFIPLGTPVYIMGEP